MSFKDVRNAQYYVVPDSRPGGPTEVRQPDPKRPGGNDAGKPHRLTRRPFGKAPGR